MPRPEAIGKFHKGREHDAARYAEAMAQLAVESGFVGHLDNPATLETTLGALFEAVKSTEDFMHRQHVVRASQLGAYLPDRRS